MSTLAVEFLKHIRDEAQFLQTTTAEMSMEQFVKDPVVTRACVRAIEIIGEATRKVPEDFRLRYIPTWNGAKWHACETDLSITFSGSIITSSTTLLEKRRSLWRFG